MQPFLGMFAMQDPLCPKCGSKVRDKVSEFLFSAEELPTLTTAFAKVTGHKCGCGYKFVVVDYEADRSASELSQATSAASSGQ